MPELRNITLIGTTSSGGAATINSAQAVFGTLYAVRWVDGSLADGVDAVLTVENAGGQGLSHTLLTLTDANADAFYYPRHVVHGEAAAALTGTSGGDRAMPLLDGTLRLVIADGGNAATGGAIVYYYHRG